MSILNQVHTDRYSAYHADTIELAQALPDNSIDYSIFSPPFKSLYVYSNSERDMGNARNDDDFWNHYRFLIKEQFRAMKPGRNLSVHCMNLPTSKVRDGFIGISDFRGDIIREYQAAGFIFHSEVCIWKNPVVAMQRTKALGLLHKQIKKDSAMSRMGIPDTIVTFRKPGENTGPIEGEFTHYVGDEPAESFVQLTRDDGRLYYELGEGTSIDVWQRYASPIWHDINQSNTLNGWRNGRDQDDERHICPLQLDVIERCLQLWTNEGDVVWSPFMGIGSEGYVSLQLGRRFIGVELKESYFDLAVSNLKNVCAYGVADEDQLDLFPRDAA